MRRPHGDTGRTFTCMSETQHSDDGTIGIVDFYLPGTAVLSERAGSIERFLTDLYRLHEFRGGVTFRSE